MHHALALMVLRRFVLGVAMAVFVAALVYSPWSKRTGAYQSGIHVAGRARLEAL